MLLEPDVGPLAKADTVFEREVRSELPAVLREAVEVPVPELAVRHARERVALNRRSLIELVNAPHEHVGSRVPGAREPGRQLRFAFRPPPPPVWGQPLSPGNSRLFRQLAPGE